MASEIRPLIHIKGIRDGLLVTLGEGDWPDLQEALFNQIEQQANFFNGARVALEVGNHILRAGDMGSLRDRLSDRGIALWAILSNSTVTETNAQALGMATRLPTPRPERVVKPLDTHLPGEAAVMVNRTMRSGFQVNYKGHVIVLGDVNPGAEIIASGNVVVWGKLRGSVHAGCDGNADAVVCTLDLAPTRLLIADQIAEFQKRKGKPVPEIVRIIDGQIQREPWGDKEGGR